MKEVLEWTETVPVIGIDEVGRGCLAGPVVAGAVLLDRALPGVRDSKTLRETAREKMEGTIRSGAMAYGIGRVPAGEIDAMGILPATFLAMRLAVDELLTAMGLPWAMAHTIPLRIDGPLLPDWVHQGSLPALAIVKGDSSHPAIAAASVLAKVVRDREMRELDAVLPGYGFGAHKGYGTRAHTEAIGALGPTAHHRMTFAPLRTGAYRN